MLLTEDTEVDLFVASKIGSFKHIKYHTEVSKNNKKCIENLIDIKTLQKDDEITCMEWGNPEQTEILIARKNQQVQIYLTVDGFKATHSSDFAAGHVVGIGRSGRRLVTGHSSGVVRVWGETPVDFQAGAKLDKLKVCEDAQELVGTGGEENDLKIWRIGEAEAIFTAKNLPHDFLELRRPVWVSDLTFLPNEGGRLAAVCSRHGYVRLYDTRAQRRPVQSVDFQLAAVCITPSFDDRQVLVGFGRGQMQQVDLRAGKPDKGYKGSAGAVTCMRTVRRGRLIVSCSLDRHLRVHEYNSKTMVYKQYLTSKLTCVLAQTETSTPLRKTVEEIKTETELKEEDTSDDMDVLFEKMQPVGEIPRKKMKVVESSENMKPSTVGCTVVDLTEEEKEEAIVTLLRSTEKQKRKREQRKREKKAKSVYHNA